MKKTIDLVILVIGSLVFGCSTTTKVNKCPEGLISFGEYKFVCSKKENHIRYTTYLGDIGSTTVLVGEERFVKYFYTEIEKKKEATGIRESFLKNPEKQFFFKRLNDTSLIILEKRESEMTERTFLVLVEFLHNLESFQNRFTSISTKNSY